jgi:hypothetical protein
MPLSISTKTGACRAGPWIGVLDKAPFRKRQRAISRNDEVVEHTHVDQGQGLL